MRHIMHVNNVRLGFGLRSAYLRSTHFWPSQHYNNLMCNTTVCADMQISMHTYTLLKAD